jgi:hypothetical protein
MPGVEFKTFAFGYREMLLYSGHIPGKHIPSGMLPGDLVSMEWQQLLS